VDIDYAACWLALKEVVLAKRSHGSNGLLAEMARLEVENRVPEGQEGFSDLPLMRVPSDDEPAKRPFAAHG